MKARRSMLFVPGSRPDRFGKALAAGADMVCVDLEDAVAPGAKSEARDVAIPWLCESGPGPERTVRINSLKSACGLSDLLAIAEAAPSCGLVLLPKADGPGEVAIADAVLTEAGCGARLVALIESLEGLGNVEAIAAASPRLDLLLFGAVDLVSELGCELDHEPLIHARSRIVQAARQAGIGAMDVPTLDFRNLEALEAETSRAKAFGFTGKAVLHPTNVPVVNAIFTPTPEETAEARKIVKAFAASDSGLIMVDGKLIEKPVIRKMEQVLAAAAAAGVA